MTSSTHTTCTELTIGGDGATFAHEHADVRDADENRVFVLPRTRLARTCPTTSPSSLPASISCGDSSVS
jgi:hypothetical protein